MDDITPRLESLLRRRDSHKASLEGRPDAMIHARLAEICAGIATTAAWNTWERDLIDVYIETMAAVAIAWLEIRNERKEK